MQRKSIIAVFTALIATIIASTVLVFALNPVVGAASLRPELKEVNIVTLNDWDDFRIDDYGHYDDDDNWVVDSYVWRGLSSDVIYNFFGYQEMGCGTIGGKSKLSFDEIQIIIPEGVTCIYPDYFQFNDSNGEFISKLTKFKISSTVKEIDYFSMNIPSLVIPSTVEYIDSDAFSNFYGTLYFESPAPVTEHGLTYPTMPIEPVYPDSGSDVEVWDQYYAEYGKYNEDMDKYRDDFDAYMADLDDNWDCLRYASCENVVWNAKYNVNFETNGGTAVATQTVLRGDNVQEATTSLDGYIFKGWYRDSECQNKYYFNNDVTEDLTLYAKWVEVDADNADVIDDNNENENNNETTNHETTKGENEVQLSSAAVAGIATGSVAGVGAISTLLGFAIKRRRH